MEGDPPCQAYGMELDYHQLILIGQDMNKTQVLLVENVLRFEDKQEYQLGATSTASGTRLSGTERP